MKILKLSKDHLDFFVSVVHKFGRVHAPVRRGTQRVLAPVERWSDVDLECTRTVLPPKKYLLPPKEQMFQFDPQRGYVPSRDGTDKRIVLFGVHACDIYAMNILDQVFAGRYPDPFYFERRRRLVVIGIDCMPDEHCFCRSMHANTVENGFDLFLSDIGEAYLVHVGTSLGDDIVLATGPLLRDVTEADIDAYKRRSSEKRAKFKTEVELRDLPEILEMEYGSEVWDELGRRCLSCGHCSMVCPTCYCYDVHDEVGLGTRSGARFRSWDSCLFKTHAMVAGGENFRKQRSSRIKFRFYHKQRGFVAEYGRPSCVGCGRCIVCCPVGIDIVKVIENIRGAEDEPASTGDQRVGAGR